jgi:hypothetical protein
MWKRLAHLAAFAAALAFALSTGCGPKSPCDGVKCPSGATCIADSGLCLNASATDGGGGPLDGAVAGDTGATLPDSDGGGGSGLDAGGSADGSIGLDASASACSPACTPSAPVCDPASATCKVCTDTLGCAAPYPVCDTTVLGGACVRCTATRGCLGDPSAPFCNTAVAGGWCVACTQDNHCFPKFCELSTHTCINEPPDAGSVPDGGAPSDAGGPSDGGIQCLHRYDAGYTPCTTGCQEGFHCTGGVCVLNGGNGPVQVTLRFDQPEDLDLHVVEPLPAGGSCEIYYGDSNNPLGTSGCGAKGSLDLDSNAGCSIDNVDIENVIYPSSQPAPSGTYTVRVDYYSHCSATSRVPYEVTVRANGQTSVYCGSFGQADDDHGGAGSGVLVTTFTVP